MISDAAASPGRVSLLRRVGLWWDDRSVAFRKTTRTSLFLLLSCVLSLVVGLLTATASAPVGPHEATWRTTLDSRITLNLGPLGMASMPSPGGWLGVEVTLEEIPAQARDTATASVSERADSQGMTTSTTTSPDDDTVSAVSPAAIAAALSRAMSSSGVASWLSADSNAYLSLVAHPEITVRGGLTALLHDALRRAGLVEAIILCLVATGRLVTAGRLRQTLSRALRHRWASSLAATTSLCCVLALVVPAMSAHTRAGVRLTVLEGTPLQGAQMSGRLADIVEAVGPLVKRTVEHNRDFYASVGRNLTAAWEASVDTGGFADMTAQDGQVSEADQEHARRRMAAVNARELSTVDPSLPTPVSLDSDTQLGSASAFGEVDSSAAATTTPDTQISAVPSALPSRSASAQASGPTAGETASDITPAQGQEELLVPPAGQVPTGAIAAASAGSITAVLTTDLHCNLDMISIAGILDTLAGATIHMDDGDLTMTGSAPEKICVDALSSAVPDGVARVATIGNHDSSDTAAQLRSHNWTVTDGSVHEVGGLRILGDVDAMRTPAGGSYQRGDETTQELGARLAQVTCEQATDVVLIHQPYTFDPLLSQGCAPLLIAGHSHVEYGMNVTAGRSTVASLRSGAGLGGTSIGPVTADAYLHVLSFDKEGRLRAWRAVVVHPDASVTVGAWRGIGEPGTVGDGAAVSVADAVAASTRSSESEGDD